MRTAHSTPQNDVSNLIPIHKHVAKRELPMPMAGLLACGAEPHIGDLARPGSGYPTLGNTPSRVGRDSPRVQHRMFISSPSESESTL
ncbi:hypothetical protein BDM02DRAFT_3124602 [Thelephora ganbajun]|uniref:Uncharacterized protein n=1 Tax=Thelephora ganbajun TaxID=370292 RepID=A0ACB6YY53_THEGA|nr:hypothetical protein BDM02DRAFT_3124602 [Thelephora ganbajun]